MKKLYPYENDYDGCKLCVMLSYNLGNKYFILSTNFSSKLKIISGTMYVIMKYFYYCNKKSFYFFLKCLYILINNYSIEYLFKKFQNKNKHNKSFSVIVTKFFT